MNRSLLTVALLTFVMASCGRAGSSPAVRAIPSSGLFSTTPRGFDDTIRAESRTPTVVNVWASWCIPCKAEAPLLKAASERYGDRVRFLGLNTRDTREEAEAFMRRSEWTYPSGFDPSGAVMTEMKVLGLPTTFFYRPGGDLALVHAGEIDEDELESKIRGLLESSSTGAARADPRSGASGGPGSRR